MGESPDTIIVEETMAALVEIGGGRTFVLGSGATIGRDPSNDINLPDLLVSRRHARLERGDDGTYRLRDLGSRQGTFVGGRRASDAVLRDGDEILIGVTRLRFDARPAAAAATKGADEPGWSVTRRLDASFMKTFRAVGEISSAGELAVEYERLRAAFELGRSVGYEHDLETVLGGVLDVALTLFPVDRGVVWLVDPDSGRLSAESRLRIERGAGNSCVVLPSSVVTEVLAHKRGVVSADTGADVRFARSESICAQGVRAAMCVPLLHRGELLGLLYLDSQRAAQAFGERDLNLATTIAAQAALLVKNALLVQRIQSVRDAEQRRLDRILRDLPDGVVLIDNEQRIVHANPRALELLPALTTARLGDRLGRLGPLPAGDLLGGEPTTRHEIVVEGPPRRFFTVTAARSVAADAGAEAVLVLRDVTEEREREATAMQLDRLALLGQLSGGIAHDFNNLLAVIINYADLAADVPTSTEQRDDLVQIRAAAQRAAVLTRQLLSFSRRELVKPEVLDLNARVREAERLLGRTLGATIALQTTLAPKLPEVEADPAQLEQIIMNLVVNARDAMPHGGELAIETAEVMLREPTPEGAAPGRYAELVVRDTGVGMTPEVLARVFEPFFTTKERGKGTGLGLATVYGAVRQAGGAISVRSAPGAGTTFRVLLPAARKPAADSATLRRLPRHGAGRLTVLVAEDQDAVRQVTSRILRQQGHTVLEAADGVEALAVAASFPHAIDLLLTDVVMPNMGGKQLATALRKVRPGVRIVYMSGYVDSSAHGMLEPEAAFLAKPFTATELLGQVVAPSETATR